MTTIGPRSQLLAEIRAQARAWRQRPAGAPASAASDARASTSSATRQDWSATIAQAVAAIHPDDPQRHRKAFRAYLQAVLARECGFHEVEDPAFQGLVDQVQAAMELDPGLQESMAAAGRALLDSIRS